jgi:hypothetical protein
VKLTILMAVSWMIVISMPSVGAEIAYLPQREVPAGSPKTGPFNLAASKPDRNHPNELDDAYRDELRAAQDAQRSREALSELSERAFHPGALQDLIDGLLRCLIRVIEPETNSSHRLTNRAIKDRRPWLEDVLIRPLFVAATHYVERWR